MTFPILYRNNKKYMLKGSILQCYSLIAGFLCAIYARLQTNVCTCLTYLYIFLGKCLSSNYSLRAKSNVNKSHFVTSSNSDTLILALVHTIFIFVMYPLVSLSRFLLIFYKLLQSQQNLPIFRFVTNDKMIRLRLQVKVSLL